MVENGHKKWLIVIEIWWGTGHEREIGKSGRLITIREGGTL
jgi:hypothetical protein